MLWTINTVNSQIVFPGDTFFLPPEPPKPMCMNHMNQPGTCKRLQECFFVYTQLGDLVKQTPCRLVSDPVVFGVCCPNSPAGDQNSGVSSAGTLFFRPPNVPIPDLRPQDIQKAVQTALIIVEKRVELEKNLFVNQIVVQPDTPVRFHLDLFPTSPQTLAVGSAAIKGLESSIQLVNQ